MMALHDFPRCSAYLKAQKYRLDDPSMSDYAWSVCLSEKWTDEQLVADGRVNFDTMGGTAILSEFERLLREGLAQEHVRKPHKSTSATLAGFLGSRGIKTNALKTPADHWVVARILWPEHIGAKDESLDRLELQVASMTKKQRRAGRENLRNVPVRWRSTIPAAE